MVVVAVAVGRGHMAVKQEFGRLYPTLRALRLVNIGSHAWLCWNLVSLFKILFCILNYTPSRSTLAVQLLMRQRITFFKKKYMVWPASHQSVFRNSRLCVVQDYSSVVFDAADRLSYIGEPKLEGIQTSFAFNWS